MRLCVGTGWYADRKGHSNFKRAKRTLRPEWLSRHWRPYIERYVKPCRYVLYLSRCEIWPEFSKEDLEDFEIIGGYDDASLLDHRHDFHCGVMMGAQWALCNQMDFLYIEQDCMVRGLDRALDWAQDKRLVYGYGDICCYSPGWAAQSLIWARNDFLPEFIGRMNVNRIHEGTGWPVPEIVFHDLFKDVADFWPFGYDRKRPDDFNMNQEVYYVQQMSDEELDWLLNH